MARIRTIKPSFFVNEELSDASRDARLLAISLLCLADREGRLADRPKRIKIEALPWDDVDVDALLNELAAVGFILRYSAEGQRWIQVVNFSKHQRPHIKESASTIPAPPRFNPGPTGDRASTDLGRCKHAQEWDPDHGEWDPGNGIQEGDRAQARAAHPAPVGKSSGAVLEDDRHVGHDGAGTEYPSPGSAAPLPKSAGHPYTDEQLARLAAAIPKDMGRMRPEKLPGQIRHELTQLVQFGDLTTDVQSEWRALEVEEQVAWIVESLRLAADVAPTKRLKAAAREIGKALQSGINLPDVPTQPVAPSKVTPIRPATGRPMSNVQQTWSVLQQAMAEEMAREAAGGGS